MAKYRGKVYSFDNGRMGIAYAHQQKHLRDIKKDVLLKMVDKDLKPIMMAHNPSMQAVAFKTPSELTFLGYVD